LEDIRKAPQSLKGRGLSKGRWVILQQFSTWWPLKIPGYPRMVLAESMESMGCNPLGFWIFLDQKPDLMLEMGSGH